MCDCHADSWIGGCDKLGIEITAKVAQSTIRLYRHRRGQAFKESNPSARTPYSPEAFVDAIVDFIISDDQVNRLKSPVVSTEVILLYSPSTSLIIPSSEPSF